MLNILMPDVHPRRTKLFGRAVSKFARIWLPAPDSGIDVGIWSRTSRASARSSYGIEVSVYESAAQLMEEPPDLILVGRPDAQKACYRLATTVAKQSPVAFGFFSGIVNGGWDWRLYDFGISEDAFSPLEARFNGIPVVEYVFDFDFDAYPYAPLKSGTPVIRSFVNDYEGRFPYAYERFCRIQELSGQSKGTPRFENVSGVSAEDVRTLITESIATIAYKEHEGYGFSVLESLSMGRPVLYPKRLLQRMTMCNWLIDEVSGFPFHEDEEAIAVAQRLASSDHLEKIHEACALSIRRVMAETRRGVDDRLRAFLFRQVDQARASWSQVSRARVLLKSLPEFRVNAGSSDFQGVDLLDGRAVDELHVSLPPDAFGFVQTLGHVKRSIGAPDRFGAAVYWGPYLQLARGALVAEWCLEVGVFDPELDSAAEISFEVCKNGGTDAMEMLAHVTVFTTDGFFGDQVVTLYFDNDSEDAPYEFRIRVLGGDQEENVWITLKNVEIRRAGSHDAPIQADPHVKVVFSNDDDVELLFSRDSFLDTMVSRTEKEPLFRNIAAALLRSGIVDGSDGIIDLGCWIGDNALPWAKLSNGVIYCIDPSNRNLEYVQRQAVLNGLANLRLIEAVVGNGVYEVGSLHPLDHAEYVRLSDRAPDTPWDHVLVATTLDDLASQGVIGQVGFLHLDVEGMEEEVLEGARALISRCRPVIAFEQHIFGSDRPGIIVESLSSLDYVVFLINEILAGCRPDCRNFLALPREKSEIAIRVCESYLIDRRPQYAAAWQGLNPLVSAQEFRFDREGRFIP